MNVFSDEMFLYAQRSWVTFKELAFLVNQFAQLYETEEEVLREVKKELDKKLQRRMNKKLP